MITVVLFHQFTAPLATGLGREVSQDQKHGVQRSHTLRVPWPRERRRLPASLSLWKMRALSVHSTKKDDSESPATRVPFPCALQDSGCRHARWRGWEEMWVPSHAPTLLPSCLPPALAEPILALCWRRQGCVRATGTCDDSRLGALRTVC